MKKPAPVKATKVENVRCKTEAQCKAISETLKESYAKGRRFRKTGPREQK
jgi:hypothetical protein